MGVVAFSKENGRINLEVNQGDLTKMEQVLEEWNFKDIQSFWRFSISILLQTEEKKLWIQENGTPILIAPAKHSLKEKNGCIKNRDKINSQ